MARNRTPLTPGMRLHLDMEMEQALALGQCFEKGQPYTEPVRRAMRLAYASYYRTLLEFFHDGRGGVLRTRSKPHARDIIVGDVLPPGVSLGIDRPSKIESASGQRTDLQLT